MDVQQRSRSARVRWGQLLYVYLLTLLSLAQGWCYCTEKGMAWERRTNYRRTALCLITTKFYVQFRSSSIQAQCLELEQGLFFTNLA